MSYEELSKLEDVPHGVPRNILANLPLLLPEENPSILRETCGICLDSFLWNDCLLVLPCCHHFHVLCIQKWLMKNDQCPVCREDVCPPKR